LPSRCALERRWNPPRFRFRAGNLTVPLCFERGSAKESGVDFTDSSRAAYYGVDQSPSAGRHPILRIIAAAVLVQRSLRADATSLSADTRSCLGDTGVLFFAAGSLCPGQLSLVLVTRPRPADRRSCFSDARSPFSDRRSHFSLH